MKVFSKLIGLLILIGALAGAVLLVQRIQETRRGATYGGIDMIFLPSDKVLKKGDRFTVTVNFDAKELKPAGVDLRIKYDQVKLRAVDIEPVKKESIGGLAFFQESVDVLDTRIDQVNGYIYLAGINMEESESKMVSVQALARMHFEVIGSGGVATVSLDGGYNNMVSGFRSDGGADLDLAISAIKAGKYTIEGIVGPTKSITVLPSKTVTRTPTKTNILPVVTKTLVPVVTGVIKTTPTLIDGCPKIVVPEGCYLEKVNCININAPCCPVLRCSKTTVTGPVLTGTENKCEVCSNGRDKSKGDANCDGGVNLTDFEFWRSEMFDQGAMMGTIRNNWKSDFDCDGKVTVFDFEQWRKNRQ